MDNTEQMAKTSAVGSVQLFFGTSISTVITAVATIILGWFIAPGDYGLYAVALVPPATISLFQDWGVGTALIRHIAKSRATKDEVEQRRVIMAGLAFESASGLILTVVSLLTASFIASMWGKPEAAFLIIFASFSILFGAIGATAGYVFTGYEKMKYNSYLLVVRAVAYTILVPLFVYLGYGALGAVIGYTLATVIQGLVCLAFLNTFILSKLPKVKVSRSEIYATMKKLLKYGIPLSIGTILSGLSGSLYSFLMAPLDNTMIGNYKVASNFAVLLTFLTGPIATVLFPLFSKVDSKNEKGILKLVFSSSVKYTVLLVAPATMVLIVLASPLIGTLYGNKFAYAPPFLALSVVFNLFSLLGWRSMGQFLPAVGETKLVMKMNLLALVISIPLAFILIPRFGITGLLLGPIISAIPGAFIGLYLSWKRYDVKADFISSGKIFIASLLASGTAYIFINFFHLPFWALFSAGTVLFVCVYLISAPLIGAINRTDIKNLRAMFSGLGIISKILEIPLKIIERLLRSSKTQQPAEDQYGLSSEPLSDIIKTEKG